MHDAIAIGRLSLLLVLSCLAACNTNEPATDEAGDSVDVELPGTEQSFGIGTIVRASAAPASEDAEAIIVEVVLAPAAKTEVNVDYMCVDGSAVQGSDYVRAKGRLSFKPGESRKSIRIALVNDEQSEADENLVLRLHTADDVTLEQAEISLIVVDDDRA